MSNTAINNSQLRDFGNALAIGAGAVGVTRSNNLSAMTRGAGLAAGLTGAASLTIGDRRQISLPGSALQTIGGFTLFAAKTPHAALAGAGLATGGALANAVERYMPRDNNHFVNPFLKGIVMGASTGLAIGSISKEPGGVAFGTVIGTIVGGIAGAITYAGSN